MLNQYQSQTGNQVAKPVCSLAILGFLNKVYEKRSATQTHERIASLIAKYRKILGESADFRLSHQDAVLITYGDMVQADEEPHLQTLNKFLQSTVAKTISTIHILPFYPWSSDDGFSVIDYLAIDPPLGNWSDVVAIRQNFRLMVDAVINHISQHSNWFQKFRQGEHPYANYFKTVDPNTDLSDVFRPRTLPLLTPAETTSGTQHVWTTFSADQIDLNYESPDLLLEILEILLTYVAHGAELIRLDAIGFMWKVPGTRSLHLPQTHAIIQLMRAVLDEVAPQVILVTETNVPHEENISYFGTGYNEAQMVYNFSLPPLMLHAFHTGNASYLTQWAASLELPSDKTTFFNFCASHDGIGVTPARGILPDSEIELIARRVTALGGRVSYKTDEDGSQSAYELNINYLNALGVPNVVESDQLKAGRFLASQAVMLALQGVPGIYFHSLFGSENWEEGVEQTGENRTINREKLQLAVLEKELETGVRHLVFSGYQEMLSIRKKHQAFNPYGRQRLHQLHPAIVAIEREYKGERILCLHNVSAEEVSLHLPQTLVGLGSTFEPILGSATPQKESITLSRHEFCWLSILED